MDRIPLIPLESVTYPGEAVPLHVFEERYCLMAEECLTTGIPFGAVLAAPGQAEDRIECEPSDVGTALDVLARALLRDGHAHLATLGRRRFRVHGVLDGKPYQEGVVTWLDEPVGDAMDAARSLADVREELARVDAEGILDEGTDPVEASYAVAAALEAPSEVKQWLLETETAAERLRLEHGILGVIDTPDAPWPA